MTAAWVIEGPGDRRAVASIRYTAYTIGPILGHKTIVFDPGDDPVKILDEERPSSLIFTKAFSTATMNLFWEAYRRDIPRIATLTDWHFEFPQNRVLAKYASDIVVPCPEMAKAVMEETGANATVIEEPVETQRREPRLKVTYSGYARLLWYGHFSNLPTLLGCFEQLAGCSDLKLLLRVVTNVQPETGEWLRAVVPQWLPWELVDWSPKAQREELKKADIVLIPTAPTKEMRVKPYDRLALAIQAGRFALCGPDVPAYRELSNYCWIGNFEEGLRSALNAPAFAVRAVTQGQDEIARRFAPEVVAEKWRTEIRSVFGEGSPPEDSSAETAPEADHAQSPAAL